MANEKPSKETNSTRRILLSKVAWLHYHEELTQAEIAERLGISRVTINRLIKERARERGGGNQKSMLIGLIISILPSSYAIVLIFRMQYITPTTDQEQALSNVLAEAAAGVLATRIQSGMMIGMGIGRTVSQIPEYFHPAADLSCRFIGLTGGWTYRLKGSTAYLRYFRSPCIRYQ